MSASIVVPANPNAPIQPSTKVALNGPGEVELNWTEVDFGDGTIVSGKAPQAPVSNEFYYIVADKCTECMGFHEEPQCAAVCPVDCCVPDPDHVEEEEILLAKKAWLHAEA